MYSHKKQVDVSEIEEPRYLQTAEEIENGYVPGSAAEAFRHAAAIRACKMRRRRVE